MDQPDREAELRFSKPTKQLWLMLGVLAAVAVIGVFAMPAVWPTIVANPWLNLFIGFVFVIGVFACFWQTYQLWGSVSWVRAFSIGGEGAEQTVPPQILAPLAEKVREYAK